MSEFEWRKSSKGWAADGQLFGRRQANGNLNERRLSGKETWRWNGDKWRGAASRLRLRRMAGCGISCRSKEVWRTTHSGRQLPQANAGSGRNQSFKRTMANNRLG